MKIGGRRNIIWIALYVMGLGVFLIVTPKYNDDWWYMSGFKDWFDSQGIWFPTDGGNPFSAGVPWHEYWKTLVYHYNVDNIRLSNIFGTFFLLFPKWVGSGIALVMWAVAMIYTFRFIGVDICRSWLVCAGLLMWCLFMPWRESMGGLIYQFNYLVPSGIYMYLLYVAWNLNGRGKHMWRLFILGLIVGAWHEGFAIPVLMGFGVILIFYKDLRTRKTVIILSGIAVGLAWLMTCPGVYLRTLNDCKISLAPGYIFDQLCRHSGVFVGVTILVIYISKKHWIAVLKDARLVFMIISAVISFLLGLSTTGTMRSGWWCDLITIAAMLYMLDKMGAATRFNSKFDVVIESVAMIPVLVILIFADIHAIRINREYRRVINEFIINREQVVFSDLLTRHPMPPGYWYMANNNNLTYSDFCSDYFNYTEDDKMLDLNIIPEKLRKIREKDGRLIPGDIGLREYEGVMYMIGDKRDYKSFVSNVDFGRMGDVTNVHTSIIPFVSEGDGKDYLYVEIWDNDIRRLVGGIESIDYNR